MNSIKTLFPLRNEEKKQKSWDDIIDRHMAFIKDLSKDKSNEELVRLYLLETDGGNCLLCGKEWKQVIFNNKFGLGVYYKPQCRCYHYCNICNTHLFIEQISGELKKNDFKCLKCGFRLIEKRS